MRQTSEKSKEIIKLLQDGKKQSEVQSLGYPIATVRYHYRKLYKPKQFKKFIKQIQGYNKTAFDKSKK